jgi:hypothetical protein
MLAEPEEILAAQPEYQLDFKQPCYGPIIQKRAQRWAYLANNPKAVQAALRVYEREPWRFITDWGCTHEPRNIEVGLPAHVPFILWPKQVEFVQWVLARWRGRQNGLVEKSRDSGVTWLAVAVACALCMLHPGIVIGFGSRKKEYLEKGAPKGIMEKVRQYMRMIPPAFRGEAWSEDQHIMSMRAMFPTTGSYITCECGDDIGRGDRTSIYFVDEAAHLEHPVTVDQALSQTTNCQIDISTPFGTANTFAIKRYSGKVSVFTFHWRDDPRKGEEWYAEQLSKIVDPVTVAQEIDISYTASVEGHHHSERAFRGVRGCTPETAPAIQGRRSQMRGAGHCRSREKS